MTAAVSRAGATFSLSSVTVSGATRPPLRLMIRLTTATAASELARRRNQRGLSGISKNTSTGTTNSPRTAGTAKSRKPFGLPATIKPTYGTKVNELASIIS
jgi:hypothetical protein